MASHCIMHPDINRMGVLRGWPEAQAYRRVKALCVNPHNNGTEAGRKYDFALRRLDATISTSARIVRLADRVLEPSADEGRGLRLRIWM